ncbi:MAG TPA: hypothetical protein VGD40_07415 [Chryseosolibacter sp.]
MTRIQLIQLHLVLVIFIASCGETKQPEHAQVMAPGTGSINLDSIQFPRLIDNGKKVVYQFTKMTPRGPRVFLDTVDYNPRQAALDSLHAKFLFPLELSEEERNTSPGIIGVSIPGVWEEAIFGTIDENQKLKINYRNTEHQLTARGKLSFNAGDFNTTFENDQIQIRLASSLSETPTKTHFSGKGRMQIFENNRLIQEADVFVVLAKPRQ